MTTIGPVDISLNFMPAFFHKHLGITYGEAFYYDPLYRAGVERAESRFLYEILGRYGVGSPTPSPSPNLFIQPIDLLKAAQGAAVYCPPDASLETRGHPWAGCSIAEIERLDPRDAAYHPFISTLLSEYRELRTLYGEEADLFGLRTGTMNVHAPFTTAHQLCGESLFYLLEDDPRGARVIFDRIWSMYRAIFTRLSSEIGAPPPSHLHLGDCSVSMISAGHYRESVLPVNQAIAAQFTSSSYHSCGASSHLLAAFSEIPGVSFIELGPGTDLAEAVRRLPGRVMCPLVDPLVMLGASPERVEEFTLALVNACSQAPAVTLCAWSFDRETPIANVEAMYSAVEAMPQNGILP